MDPSNSWDKPYINVEKNPALLFCQMHLTLGFAIWQSYKAVLLQKIQWDNNGWFIIATRLEL